MVGKEGGECGAGRGGRGLSQALMQRPSVYVDVVSEAARIDREVEVRTNLKYQDGPEI
eukprot:m.114461 g.114461  ORF g.114461 m.114461 type:complete len:58 (+) comp28354_c0_seq1:1800-1973(+)